MFGEDRFKCRTYVNIQQIMGYSLFPDFPEEKERCNSADQNGHTCLKSDSEEITINKPLLAQKNVRRQPNRILLSENQKDTFEISEEEKRQSVSYQAIEKGEKTCQYTSRKDVQGKLVQTADIVGNPVGKSILLSNLSGKESAIDKAENKEISRGNSLEKRLQYDRIQTSVEGPAGYKINNDNGNAFIKDSGNFTRKT
ncbi:hypothetical protein [Sediminibacillus halophilus]|uniref:hypothetical protein n=1 Tax=Sediminibacillus halophilus TaxID=482461 RepID=UPI001113DDE1|nr:hypothetical protein [Sediminibacillus halophilus]